MANLPLGSRAVLSKDVLHSPTLGLAWLCLRSVGECRQEACGEDDIILIGGGLSPSVAVNLALTSRVAGYPRRCATLGDVQKFGHRNSRRRAAGQHGAAKSGAGRFYQASD